MNVFVLAVRSQDADDLEIVTPVTCCNLISPRSRDGERDRFGVWGGGGGGGGSGVGGVGHAPPPPFPNRMSREGQIWGAHDTASGTFAAYKEVLTDILICAPELQVRMRKAACKIQLVEFHAKREPLFNVETMTCVDKDKPLRVCLVPDGSFAARAIFIVVRFPI